MMTGLVAAAGTFTLLGGMLARRARTVPARRAQRLWPYALALPGLAHLSATFLDGTGSWVCSMLAFIAAIGIAGAQPAAAPPLPASGD
jgi:hypothetical protein